MREAADEGAPPLEASAEGEGSGGPALGRLYRRAIQPLAVRLEAERQAGLARVRLIGSGGAGVAAMPALGLALAGERLAALVTGLAGLGFAGTGAALAWFQAEVALNERLRAEVLPLLGAHLGGLEVLAGPVGFDETPFLATRLLPARGLARFEDLIEGVHRGRAFRRVRVRVQRPRRRGGDRSLFAGILIALDAPRRLPGVIRLSTGRGALGNHLSARLESLAPGRRPYVEDDAFSLRFHVEADDAVMARQVLDGELRHRLMRLADAARGRTLRVALGGDLMLVALSAGGAPRLLRLARPVARLEAATRALFAEISLPLRVIDILDGREARPLF